MQAFSATKQPWNVVRFLNQSSKFVQLMPSSSKKTVVQKGGVLWTPDDKAQSFRMAPLDDVVMGGVSASTVSKSTWTGRVTDANNGGFVGIRSTPGFVWDASACRGLEWEIHLDAKSLSCATRPISTASRGRPSRDCGPERTESR